MTTSSTRAALPVKSLLKILLATLTISLLLLSWGLLFRFIVLEINVLLPYDTSWYAYWGWPQGSPPPDSWQRSLNYFFESRAGSILPAILAVGIDALLLVVILFRDSSLREKHLLLLFGFTVTNIISVPAMFLVSYAITAILSGALSGWNVTMLSWLMSLLLLVLLFTVQGSVLPQKLVRKKYA